MESVPPYTGNIGSIATRPASSPWILMRTVYASPPVPPTSSDSPYERSTLTVLRSPGLAAMQNPDISSARSSAWERISVASMLRSASSAIPITTGVSMAMMRMATVSLTGMSSTPRSSVLIGTPLS